MNCLRIYIRMRAACLVYREFRAMLTLSYLRAVEIELIWLHAIDATLAICDVGTKLDEWWISASTPSHHPRRPEEAHHRGGRRSAPRGSSSRSGFFTRTPTPAIYWWILKIAWPTSTSGRWIALRMTIASR